MFAFEDTETLNILNNFKWILFLFQMSTGLLLELVMMDKICFFLHFVLPRSISYTVNNECKLSRLHTAHMYINNSDGLDCLAQLAEHWASIPNITGSIQTTYNRLHKPLLVLLQ